MEMPISLVESFTKHGFSLKADESYRVWPYERDLGIAFKNKLWLKVSFEDPGKSDWESLDLEDTVILGLSFVDTRSRRVLNHIALTLGDATLLRGIDAR